MRRKDLVDLIPVALASTAVISFAGIGVFLTAQTTTQNQEATRHLVGRERVWSVIRQQSALDHSAECFITANIPWAPTNFLIGGEALAFAPELGLPVRSASLAINLSEPELRVSLPDEAIGSGFERRQLLRSSLDFHVEFADVTRVTFDMRDDSEARYRRIPMSENGIRDLVAQMQQGKRLYANWAATRDSANGDGRLHTWQADYFLPLDSFKQIVTVARSRCDNPPILSRVAPDDAEPGKTQAKPGGEPEPSPSRSIQNSSEQQLKSRGHFLNSVKPAEQAPVRAMPSDDAETSQEVDSLGDYRACGISCIKEQAGGADLASKP